MGRELTQPERERATKLAEGTVFSDDEARRIVRFATAPAAKQRKEMLLPDDGSDYATDDVDAETCAEIRRIMVSARDVREVVKEFRSLSASQIFAHSKGRCNHDGVSEPTTLSPRVGIDECRGMRDAFVDGASIKTIKCEFYRSTNAVLNHVFGNCDHDHDPRGSHLSDSKISRLIEVYESSSSRTMAEVGAAFRVSPSTVHYHVEDR